jgi:hypothetical protein
MKTDWNLTLKFDPNKKMFFPKSLPKEMEVLDYNFIERSDLLRIETIMWMLFGEEGARRTYDYVERLGILESELGRFKIYLEIEREIIEGCFGVFCAGFHKVLNYPILTHRVIDYFKKQNILERMEGMGFKIDPCLQEFIENRANGCLV